MNFPFSKAIYILVVFLILVWMIPTPAMAVNLDKISEKDALTFANEHNTYVICYQQGARNSNFYQYDSTPNFMFFSYSEDNCVDVYNLEGIFQFSYIFPNKQNGSISIRCVGDRVYIGTKDDEVFVFDGTQIIAHLSCDDALTRGYDFSWFRNKDGHMTVDGNWISFLNSKGTIIKRIQTPLIIKKTLPPAGLELLIKPSLGIVSVLCLSTIHSIRKHQNLKKHSNN